LLFKYLPQNIEDALQSQEELFLLCINIDNMKHFNTHNGHVLGDELLKRFVARTTPMLGEQQKLFRYGGDWFAIVSINKTLKEVVLLAQQMCNDVRKNLSPPQPDNCGCKDCLGPASITISVGIAKLETGMTVTTLMHSAEEQLNKAKCSGRDCIYIDNHKYAENIDTR
jgi:diguanylate cyclase (GGDEF)-like protein